jgi:hypothetical protein
MLSASFLKASRQQRCLLIAVKNAESLSLALHTHIFGNIATLYDWVGMDYQSIFNSTYPK